MNDNRQFGQGEPDAQDVSREVEEGQGIDQSRRKFSKTGLIAVPVIMTLASRPALADKNFCTISGWGSVHASGRPANQYCDGRSPGYWKTYWSSTTAQDWDRTGFNPGPTNLISAANDPSRDYSVPTKGALDQAVTAGKITVAQKNAYITAIQAAATLDTLMGTAPGTWSPRLTLAHANGLLPINQPTVMMTFHLNEYKQGLAPGNAAFHYAAALLNAARWGRTYGYTLAEMRALITANHGTTDFVGQINWLHHHGFDSVNGVSNPYKP